MALRNSFVATVAVIIVLHSSALLAGAGEFFDSKKPEVSCELKVKEDYRFYDVDGTDATQLRKQMKERGTRWDDGKVYAAVTSWDIRYSYDVSYDHGSCSVKSVKTDVEIVYQLPHRISVAAPPELTPAWDGYLERLKGHEFGHKDIAVKTAGEINQALASLKGFGSFGELEREATRLAEERLQRMKTAQVEYDHQTRHGETQGAVLAGP